MAGEYSREFSAKVFNGQSRLIELGFRQGGPAGYGWSFCALQGMEKPFQLRIGINTGFCTVGNFGSEDRMDYTIIGGEVNLASRLQSHADLGGILVAHETYSLVKDEILTEEPQPIRVKGFAQPIRTYRILGICDDLIDQRNIVRHQQDGIKIEVDLERLSPEDRPRVIQVVEGLLSRLKADPGSRSA